MRTALKRVASRVLFALRGTFYLLLIVFAFYAPTQWLIPDEQGFARWAVWCLGWTAGWVVQMFGDWYTSTR